MYSAYLHIRPDKTGPDSIFYVGKGNERRVKKTARKHNKHHTAIVKKVGLENVEVHAIACSSEEAAFALEVGLIKCLRRMGVTLCNQTDGGEGPSGYSHTAETRRKLSVAGMGNTHLLGHTASAETRAKISAAGIGRICSAETKAHMSASGIGRIHSDAVRANMSAAQRTPPLKPTNTSGHNGVNWSKPCSKWKVSIKADAKSIHLGYFDDLEEAIAARKAGEEKYWK